MTPSLAAPSRGGRPTNYLPTLDGWRAIAICMVLFAHLRLPGNALSWLAPYGALGVHLFFAISGFLITYRLLEEEHASGRVSLRSFYLRRAFRILPAAGLYLLVVAGLGFLAGWIPVDRSQLLASAFFYRNYLVQPPAQSWYTGHYWSLSVEEHFYLLWPAVLIAIASRHRRWVVPALAVGFAAWRALDTQFQWVAASHPALKDLVERTDYRMDALLWGCSAALLWQSGVPRHWLARRGHYAFLPIAIMALCLIFEPPAYIALLALLMPLPVLLTAANPDGRMARFLESPFLVWFGRLSYSVYLWQMLFLPTYGIPISLGLAQRFPWNLFLVAITASASYYLIERPARRFGRRFCGSSKPLGKAVELHPPGVAAS